MPRDQNCPLYSTMQFFIHDSELVDQWIDCYLCPLASPLPFPKNQDLWFPLEPEVGTNEAQEIIKAHAPLRWPHTSSGHGPTVALLYMCWGKGISVVFHYTHKTELQVLITKMTTMPKKKQNDFLLSSSQSSRAHTLDTMSDCFPCWRLNRASMCTLSLALRLWTKE